MKKLNIKTILLIIFFTIALIFLFIHLGDIVKVLSVILTVLMPILYGLVLAYLLNYPYKLFYDHAFKNMGKKHKWLSHLRMPLSMIISYVLIFGIVIFLVGTLIPELSSSISTLVKNIPAYERTIRNTSDDVVAFIKNATGYNLYEVSTYSNLITMITGDSTTEFIKNLITNLVPSAFSTLLGIGTGVYNWAIGIVISIYLLASKERLLHQSKRVITAYTPERFHIRFFKVADVFNNKCGKFIVGKIIDSTIIGIMCFIGLSIFRFHYPLLISVVVGLFNLIPFFGPIIGAIPCTFLLLIINPLEALWFIVFIIILQQFDGNILGPKILGETVGISGFWIMVSVIIGGGLFGLPGMLLGVPIFAAIYTLIQEGTERREAKKKEKTAQLADIAESTAEEAPAAEQEPVKEETNNA